MGANCNNYLGLGFSHCVTLCPYLDREEAIEVHITITNAEHIYSQICRPWGCRKPPWPELHGMVLEN